ncbi:MAG: 4-(cytidine 5'-diphospho)-2-C-methyl-D-erythritol kinase [Dehalococcoidales bacterium]|nr:4-(cytidine 5'-diphospho)-2-C-methyl-D-erythritol kinase [Dehalococcoidales bacterium]
MLTVLAPAKLNLTLEVLAKRPDGLHEIRSVIQTINLCDSLHFRLSQDIRFKFNAPDLIPEESLVSKAAGLLHEATGCVKGVTIEVSKGIPLLSGLGGDSSDAAATLHGLNKLWGLGLSPRELLELALKLGSDVAFFLYGGTALVEGRGEIVTLLPPLPQMWVVVMIPPLARMPGKTERLYASLRASHYTDGQITDRLVALLTGGGEVTPSSLFNVFEDVAPDNFTGLREYWQQFLKAGAQQVHLAGSGPALFTLIKDKAQAEELYIRLRQQRLESYLTDTLAAIEQKE